MTNDLTSDEVRMVLKLEPHATRGFVRVTFISNQRIAPGGLPARGLRALFHGDAGCAGATPSHS